MKIEIYDLGFNKYRVVEKSWYKIDNVYDVFEWEKVDEIIKLYSMSACINHHKHPTFIFYF